MISKRTQHYTELVLLGLRRGWHVGKVCTMGRAGLLYEGMKPDPQFPSRVAVFDWVAVDAQFAEAYLAARRAGCEALVDELFAISDDNSDDDEWCVSEKTGELVKAVQHEHINRSRLRVDSRKWYVSKLVPRLYGERVEIEHKGNVELVSRLTAGRQRALGEAQPDGAPMELTRDASREALSAGSGVVIEGSATRVRDDGSELV